MNIDRLKKTVYLAKQFLAKCVTFRESGASLQHDTEAHFPILSSFPPAV